MSDFDVIIVGGGIAGAASAPSSPIRRRTLIIEAEDQCGYHTTGRSAAFWLAHYGGPEVMPLTLASGPFSTRAGRPASARWLRRRGAITIARRYMDLREALASNSRDAPLSELEARRAGSPHSGAARRLGLWSLGSELRRHRRRWPPPGVPRAFSAHRRKNPVLGAPDVGARSRAIAGPSRPGQSS